MAKKDMQFICLCHIDMLYILYGQKLKNRFKMFIKKKSQTHVITYKYIYVYTFFSYYPIKSGL